MPFPPHRHPVVLAPSSGAPTYNAPQWSLAVDSVTGVVQDTNPTRRVTQVVAEAVVQDTNPTRRVTQIVIEVVVGSNPRFWATVIT